VCAERLLSSIIDMNDLNHDAQQVSVYLELDALPCGAACVAVGLKLNPPWLVLWDAPRARSLPLGHARGTATHHLPASMRCAC
jgi:hypothetical protein